MLASGLCGRRRHGECPSILAVSTLAKNSRMHYVCCWHDPKHARYLTSSPLTKLGPLQLPHNCVVMAPMTLLAPGTGTGRNADPLRRDLFRAARQRRADRHRGHAGLRSLRPELYPGTPGIFLARNRSPPGSAAAEAVPRPVAASCFGSGMSAAARIRRCNRMARHPVAPSALLYLEPKTMTATGHAAVRHAARWRPARDRRRGRRLSPRRRQRQACRLRRCRTAATPTAI